METSTWTRWRPSSPGWTGEIYKDSAEDGCDLSQVGSAVCVCFCSDGSWSAPCLTVGPVRESQSVPLTSVRFGTSARAPVTSPTACSHTLIVWHTPNALVQLHRSGFMTRDVVFLLWFSVSGKCFSFFSPALRSCDHCIWCLCWFLLQYFLSS